MGRIGAPEEERGVYAALVCDDADENAYLGLAVQRAGLLARSFRELSGALSAWRTDPGALIVLSLRTDHPWMQVGRIRAETSVPLVVVVGRADEDELVRTYAAGADLVIPRPWSPRVFAMQVRALAQRDRGRAQPGVPDLVAGGLRLDVARREAVVDQGDPRHLTQLEFRLLYLLMLHQGQTLPIATIVDRVWGYAGEGSSELVRGLVRRLRQKLGEDVRSPRFVITVPGVGYRLEAG
ncbi:MAG: winged helix-turn-helix transcriptional regulator [Anaerolineae bacterium]